MVEHELKVWPAYFEALLSGDKTFEFRKDDREPRFAVGDMLRLREWSNFGTDGQYTGREILRRVRYIARSFVLIPDGFCVMSLADPSKPEPSTPTGVVISEDQARQFWYVLTGEREPPYTVAEIRQALVHATR